MFSVFAKLGWFFKQEWRRYTIAITLLLIVNVLEMRRQDTLARQLMTFVLVNLQHPVLCFM